MMSHTINKYAKYLNKYKLLKNFIIRQNELIGGDGEIGEIIGGNEQGSDKSGMSKVVLAGYGTDIITDKIKSKIKDGYLQFSVNELGLNRNMEKDLWILFDSYGSPALYFLSAPDQNEKVYINLSHSIESTRRMVLALECDHILAAYDGKGVDFTSDLAGDMCKNGVIVSTDIASSKGFVFMVVHTSKNNKPYEMVNYWIKGEQVALRNRNNDCIKK